ncbi:5500_t:CDS:2 [Ambispora gerdemannii]|uniref:RBR-type E3 ubiquitin transferase n=1 Tax=Ambispora gerdemannii TaxID=144530 RepID=A0A9N9FT10_9GLOM|nr:5500_t:CDS:2 [Ambispora gerdemannii]
MSINEDHRLHFPLFTVTGNNKNEENLDEYPCMFLSHVNDNDNNTVTDSNEKEESLDDEYLRMFFPLVNDNDTVTGNCSTSVSSSLSRSSVLDSSDLTSLSPTRPSRSTNSAISSKSSALASSSQSTTSVSSSRSSALTSSPQKKECIICTETFDMTQLIQISIDCQHEDNICQECAARHIEHELQNKGNVEIRCPDEDCRSVMTGDQVKKLSSETIFERYQKLLLALALSQIDDFYWCLNPNCGSGQIHYEGDIAPIMTCQSCSKKTCVTHSLPIPDGSLSCPQCTNITEHVREKKPIKKKLLNLFKKSHGSKEKQNETSTAENELAKPKSKQIQLRQALEKLQMKRKDRQKRRIEEKSKVYIDSMTKQCPKCNANIEKYKGCDHMKCRAPRCGYEFCWLCFADYEAIRENGNNCHMETCKYYA